MRWREFGDKIQDLVDQWNTQVPIGTTVDYFSARWNQEPKIRTKTRSAAYVLSGHTAVVMLDGVSGCVAISHCVVVNVERPS